MTHPVRRSMVRIALVGDFDPNVTAHRAIPLALRRAGTDAGVEVQFTWFHTAHLGRHPERALATAAGEGSICERSS